MLCCLLGDETSSNDGSLRGEVDYSTLARAEAAAQQQHTASSQAGFDSAAGPLQRSRPLPSSSDAGHLALGMDQAGDSDDDGSTQNELGVNSSQDAVGRSSAFDNLTSTSGKT